MCATVRNHLFFSPLPARRAHSCTFGQGFAEDEKKGLFEPLDPIAADGFALSARVNEARLNVNAPENPPDLGLANRAVWAIEIRPFALLIRGEQFLDLRRCMRRSMSRE